MKAAYFTGHGGNEVVQVGQRPDPVRRPGDVLVRVEAASVNRVDLYMRNSGAGITHRVPQIFGVDGAGVVEAIDADEPSVRAGQRVVLYPGLTCGRCEFCLRGQEILCLKQRLVGEHADGTFAERIAVPAANVLPLPDGWSMAEGASLCVNFLTAWRMLQTQAQLRPWETVLVFGIGGGVSLAGLQLAKAMGARAIVTSRDADKLERARAVGADAVVDGRGDIVRQVMDLTNGRGVDVVFENVGDAVWSAALKSLVRGGRLVTCGATTGAHPSADLQRVFIRQLRILGSTLGTLAEFRDLLDFVARHGILPIVHREFALDDVRAAFDRLDSGQQFGKVVLRIAEAAPGG